MNIVIGDDDVCAVEEEMSMGKGAWDMVNHKELVKACVVVFLRKILTQLEVKNAQG